ncbi:MAG: MFS transporter [Candidatus Binatia bacterium]
MKVSNDPVTFCTVETEAESRPKARLPLATPFFYGWLVVALSFITALATSGTRSALTVMILPLEAEFGWSRMGIATAASMTLFLQGLTAPLGGWLMDRFGPRRMILISLTLLVIGITATTQMRQMWQLILFWGVMTGIGAGLLGEVLGATVANRWFVTSRGLALGILNSSNSTGQLIFLPLLMVMIVSTGWRGSIMVLVAFMLILMPIIAFLMRDDPAEVGLKPLGMEESATSATGQPGRNPNADQMVRATSITEAVKNRTFWLLCGCFFICGATSAGLVGTHLIPHAIDQGFPEVKAAATIGVMGAMNFVGTMLSGVMTDRVQPRKLLAIFYTLRGVSLFILPQVTTFPGLFVFAVIFGLDWFATVPPTIAITADTFGRRSIGRLYGWIFLSHQFGSASMAIGAGMLYNWFGDYRLAFNIGGVLGLIAGVTALRMPDRSLEPLANPVPVKS